MSVLPSMNVLERARQRITARDESEDEQDNILARLRQRSGARQAATAPNALQRLRTRQPLTEQQISTIARTPHDALIGDTSPRVDDQGFADRSQPDDEAMELHFAQKLRELNAQPAPDQRTAGAALRKFLDNPIKAIPFLGGVAEVSNLGSVFLAAKRIEGGTATNRDKFIVAKFARDNAGEATIGNTVVGILTGLPAFAGEIALTGGLFTAGRKLTTEGIKKLVGKSIRERIEKSFAGRVALETAGIAAGSAAITPAFPHLILANAIQRSLPAIDATDANNIAVEFDKPDQSFVDAIRSNLGAGFLDTYIELASERTGVALLPVQRLLGNLKATILKRWLAVNPKRTVGQFLDRVKSATAWNGILGEMFEERVGEAARFVTGLEDQLLPSGKQLISEAIAFSVPGATRAGIEGISVRRSRGAARKLDLLTTEGTAKFVQSRPEVAQRLATVKGTPSRGDVRGIAGAERFTSEQRTQFQKLIRERLPQLAQQAHVRALDRSTGEIVDVQILPEDVTKTLREEERTAVQLNRIIESLGAKTSLAASLRKSKLPSGVKSYLRQQARDSSSIQAVDDYLALTKANLNALRAARKAAKPPAAQQAPSRQPAETIPPAPVEPTVQPPAAPQPTATVPNQGKLTFADINAMVEEFAPGFTAKGAPRFGRGGRGKSEAAIQALRDSGDSHQQFLAELLAMRDSGDLSATTVGGGLVALNPATLKVGDTFSIGNRGATVRSVTDFSATIDLAFTRGGQALQDTFTIPINRTIPANRGTFIPSTIGRPELASPATSEASRAVVDEVDEQRKQRGVPERRADVEVIRAAQAKLEADREGAKQQTLDTAARGEQLSDVDTLVAKELVDDAARDAVADESKIPEAVALIEAYRATGTEQARAFRQRRDPLKSPAERAREYLNETILAAGEKDAKALRKLQDREAQTRRKIADTTSPGVIATLEQNLQTILDRKQKILDRVASESKKILKALRNLGISPTQITDEQLADPRTRYRIVRTTDTVRASVFDAAKELWLNSILSGPQTQAANIIGNTVNGLWETTAQRLVEGITNIVVRAPEGVQLSEYKAVMRGILPGLARASRNFWTGFSTEAPVLEEQVREAQRAEGKPETALAGTKIELSERKKAISGVKGRVIRIPTRLLIAFDELAKGFFGTIEGHAQAYRIAKSEGLEGEAVGQRAQELVDDLSSPAWDVALREAERLAFQTPLGPIGTLALKARNVIPGAFYVVPFITTFVNIFKAGLAKTPLVSIPTAYRIAREGVVRMGITDAGGVEYTRGQFNRDLANNVVAWAGFLALMSLSGEDDDTGLPLITGTTRFDRGERSLAFRSAPPQSIRIGGKWYSYARIEPLAVSLSTQVDLINEIKRAKSGKAVDDAIIDFLGSFKRQASNKTFLQGFGEVVRILEDENNRTLLRIAQNIATGFVPNLIKQAGRASDPVFRETRQRGEGQEYWHRFNRRTLHKALPFQGTAPHPKIDLWGRTVEKHTFGNPGTDFLYRLTIPVRIQDTDNVTKIDRLILNWNTQNPNAEFFPRPATTSITISGEKIDLSDAEYSELLRTAGRLTLDKLLDLDLNVETPTENDIRAIKLWIDRGRQVARSRLRERVLKRSTENER